VHSIAGPAVFEMRLLFQFKICIDARIQVGPIGLML